MNPHQVAKLQSADKDRFAPEAGRLSVQEEMDYQILRFLRDHEVPVGAGKIRTALSGSGPSRSEAAIGRNLRRYQEEGYVHRCGFQGQVITELGRKRLRDLENERQFQSVAQNLIKRIKEDHGEALFNVLQARRAIESEAARLAANRASDEEIMVLEDNLVAQKQQLAARKSNAELNRQFHELLVDLSRNRLLGSMYDLIELNSGLARIFEQGRVQQGRSLGRDHARIVRAIKLRNGSLAAAEVCRHIEDTIADMEQYVARYRDVQPKE